MYLPLPSVIIDIVGQNNKKGANGKYQKRTIHAHSIHLAEKYPVHNAKRFSFSRVFYIIGLLS